MDVKRIVDTLYEDRLRDRVLPVSRYTHQQQTLRLKVELANIYLELFRLRHAMDDAQISISPVYDREPEVLRMVEEDEAAFVADMKKNKFDRREDAYDDGSKVELIRRMLMGDPIDPYLADDTMPLSDKEALAEQAKAVKEKVTEDRTHPPSRKVVKKNERKKNPPKWKRFTPFNSTSQSDTSPESEKASDWDPEYDKKKEEEIEAILSRVNKKGGIQYASESDMQDLGAIIDEVEAHLA